MGWLSLGPLRSRDHADGAVEVVCAPLAGDGDDTNGHVDLVHHTLRCEQLSGIVTPHMLCEHHVGTPRRRVALCIGAASWPPCARLLRRYDCTLTSTGATSAVAAFGARCRALRGDDIAVVVLCGRHVWLDGGELAVQCGDRDIVSVRPVLPHVCGSDTFGARVVLIDSVCGGVKGAAGTLTCGG